MKVMTKEIKDNGFDLKNALEDFGISQRKFAKLCGINFAHINKICNGLSTSQMTAKKITNAYNKMVEPKRK